MKIGIDISQIVYQTGVSRYTANLVEHLLKLDKKNHYFLFAGSLRQKNLLKAFIKKIKTRKTSHKLSFLSPRLADFFWNQLSLLPPDKNQNLDLFHASNFTLPKTNCPLITTIHDLTFLKYPQEHTNYNVKAHTRHLKRAKQLAKIIITDSKSTKNDLIDYGIDESKIKVIYPAPAKIFKPVKDKTKLKKIKQKYNLKKNFILSVGTQEPRKNLISLITAYSKLKPPKPDLVIAGKFGWGEKTKPKKGVKLLGFVPDQDLVGLYSSAKCFVYPSLYEGFGFPILEALSCGCPVITSKTSSLPELGGKAVLYIDPHSVTQIKKAIKQLLNVDDSNHRYFLKQAKKQLKKFSWGKTARQTLKIYQEVKNDNRS